MSRILPQKPITVRDELTVNNLLSAEVQVTMYKGVVTLDLTKTRPPVIITLQPGIPASPAMEKMSRHDYDQVVRGRRADLGAG